MQFNHPQRGIELSDVILRNLGKVLLVGDDSSRLPLLQAKLEECEGTVVEIASSDLEAFIKLSDPNHGYNHVFVDVCSDTHPEHPNSVKLRLREQLGVFDT